MALPLIGTQAYDFVLFLNIVNDFFKKLFYDDSNSSVQISRSTSVHIHLKILVIA
jgi:hypothetical protein